MLRIFSNASLILLAAAQLAIAAGPRVDIVIGEKAPALEKRAAEDVAADLKKVYDAEVKIATAAPEGAENVIFVGSPETNEQTKKQISEIWPNLTEQGHVLRTVRFRGKPAIFIGGGSPVAVYWAASEYAHSLGIRSLLYGDLYPVSPKPFSLAGYDTLRKPVAKERSWQFIESSPAALSSWGLNDQKLLLHQLARLKFNRLTIEVHPWQPFIQFEHAGVKKQTHVLWYGWQFPVSGDTAGRAAFRGARFFENPDFSAQGSKQLSVKAGQTLVNGLIDEAHSLGMKTSLVFNPLEFAKEFAEVLPEARVVPDTEGLAVTLAEGQNLDNEKVAQLLDAQLKAYLSAYPGIDGLTLSGARSGSLRSFMDQRKAIVGEREVQFASREIRLSPMPLAMDKNYKTYFLSQWSFDFTVTDESACQSLVVPVCGEGVDGVVLKAQSQMEEGNGLSRKNDPEFTLPNPNMLLKHYASSDPPPEWWSKVRDNYLGAMNDMYRANSRAREGGRSYTLYLARRCEFGYEYMNCVEATRLAGIAKGKKDTAEQRAQLEKAIESMNAACSALAAVARDQSDRGMIAVCNEFGYKALQKELEKLDAEESK